MYIYIYIYNGLLLQLGRGPDDVGDLPGRVSSGVTAGF